MSRRLSNFMTLLVLIALLAACGTTTDTATNPGQPVSSTTTERTAGATPEAQTAVRADVPMVTETASTMETSATAATVTASGASGRTLTIMSHDSFTLSEEVVTRFEQANGVKLQFLKAGDAGSTLNRAILTKNNPLADILFGVDNTFFSRALEQDVFESYEPAGLQQIPADFRLDPENRLIPIDYGFVNLNYDLAAFGPGKLPVPQALRDLTQPAYKGKLVVENPATSSPGLAFLLVTIATFGESGDYTYLEFWRDLLANDVQIVNDWETAYYTNFSGSSGKGPQPLVLSYATSPAAEVAFSDGKLKEPPTGNILPPKGAFRQIEFAGILKGTKNRDLAEKWMDYMLSSDLQNDVMPQMVVYPVLPAATIPDVYRQFAPIPPEPAVIAPDEIAANRERWIQAWTEAVGQ